MCVCVWSRVDECFTDADIETYEAAYQEFDCAGALIWSLRGHSQQSGFDTHSEGNNIFSYHAPGWLNQTSASFDTQESAVVSATYNARYTYNSLSLCFLVFSSPSSPLLFFEDPNLISPDSLP